MALWSTIELAGAGIEGVDVSKVMLNYKYLEIARGFLVHFAMTFETFASSQRFSLGSSGALTW
jgi:hypothetical protein